MTAMNATPLIIGEAERMVLAELRNLAAERPVDMRTLEARLKTDQGKAAHRERMTEQSRIVPVDFLVTFSIEQGHPAGTCRHMSMSSPKMGRLPTPEAVWLVAELLGFVGDIDACMSWVEDLQGHGRAINLVQPVDVLPGGHA